MTATGPTARPTSRRRLLACYIVLAAISGVTIAIALLIGPSVAGSPVSAVPPPASATCLSLSGGQLPHRSAEEIFGRLMLAIAVVILAARLAGAAVHRVGQPRVMGEVVAGILLGPSLLGAVALPTQCYLFPPDIVPLITAVADVGLVFYMFLVGLELDPAMLRGRVGQAALISNAGVAIPMSLGILVAIPLYSRLGTDKGLVPFALFMGVAMSITAFPVLARILVERRMIRSPIGVLVMSAAAVDDVTAWGLLAFATAVTAGVGAGSELPLVALGVRSTGLPAVVLIVAYVAVFVTAMGLLVRPLLARVSIAFDEAGHVPPGWVAAIFVGVLLSAFASQQVGIAAIFGAFVMGFIMPRRADLTHDVSRRLEDFVVTVLLPLFFVATGLRTQVGLLDRPELWLIAVLLVAVAVLSKWASTSLAGLATGLSVRESAAVGALMNTRGLTELIVLNIALSLQVISPEIFAILVIMALATTAMAGPALRVIDPHGSLASPPEEELRNLRDEHAGARKVRERSILVAALDGRNLDALMSLAISLARSQPPREIIVVRLLPPTSLAAGISEEDRELAAASVDLEQRRARLASDGIHSRAVAFVSARPGEDVIRLGTSAEVDLLLIDGSRPLMGGGVPRGPVGVVLEHAPCDVAVLVSRTVSGLAISAEHPIVVPFGGAEHDWAALELGAWIASSTGSRLRLLGALPGSRMADGSGDVSRLLADASLVVQQLAGVAAEPVLIEPGRAGVLHGAENAGLLVIGLAQRWREEGLGSVRSSIAQLAPVPTLFVRRGLRPGALAPRTDGTRFAWSSVGVASAAGEATGPLAPEPSNQDPIEEARDA